MGALDAEVVVASAGSFQRWGPEGMGKLRDTFYKCGEPLPDLSFRKDPLHPAVPFSSRHQSYQYLFPVTPPPCYGFFVLPPPDPPFSPPSTPATDSPYLISRSH